MLAFRLEVRRSTARIAGTYVGFRTNRSSGEFGDLDKIIHCGHLQVRFIGLDRVIEDNEPLPLQSDHDLSIVNTFNAGDSVQDVTIRTPQIL